MHASTCMYAESRQVGAVNIQLQLHIVAKIVNDHVPSIVLKEEHAERQNPQL